MRKSASHLPKNFLKARAIQNIREIYAWVLEFFVLAKLRSESFWLHFLQGRITPLHIHFFVMQRSTIDCTFISFFVETWKVASRLVEKWVIGGGLAVCVADAMLVAWPNRVLRCARLMLSLVGVCTDTDAARWLCVRLALAFAGAAIVNTARPKLARLRGWFRCFFRQIMASSLLCCREWLRQRCLQSWRTLVCELMWMRIGLYAHLRNYQV